MSARGDHGTSPPLVSAPAKTQNTNDISVLTPSMIELILSGNFFIISYAETKDHGVQEPKAQPLVKEGLRHPPKPPPGQPQQQARIPCRLPPPRSPSTADASPCVSPQSS